MMLFSPEHKPHETFGFPESLILTLALEKQNTPNMVNKGNLGSL
jgi:hypothetical protein